MKKLITTLITAVVLSAGFISLANAYSYGNWKLDKAASYEFTRIVHGFPNKYARCVYRRAVYEITSNNKLKKVGEQVGYSEVSGGIPFCHY